MKLIHCADLHLDSPMTANLDKEKSKERKAELLRTFMRMMDYAGDNSVDAILLAGDIFDTRNVTATTRNVVLKAINDNPNIEFYYLKGNHDSDSFISELEEIPENLKLFDNGWKSYNVKDSDVVVTGVELSKDNSVVIYDSLVLDYDKVNIVLMHGQEQNSDSQEKNKEVIRLGGLRSKGIDYLALGHIHSYKVDRLDTRGVYCYPGCLEGRGFDECGTHGFVLLEIEGKSVRHIFVPFAERQIYAPEVDITGLLSTVQIIDAMKAVATRLNISDKSMVKFILKGEVDITCEINMELLKKTFENEYFYVKIYDESKLKIDYNEYALDRSLKGEFVRTVQNSDLDEATKIEVIRCGIQALSGEGV